ncbi:hypothetical protein FOA52_015356 [Chlamydomonas sp. UWO 241]|nr:hypothetical protein FOA52_015356 [Chlamydomonas sp. UWO 241]
MSDSSSVTSLAPLSACAHLQSASIHHCTSVASVEPLAACAQLEELSIMGTPGDLPGLVALKAALPRLRIKNN